MAPSHAAVARIRAQLHAIGISDDPSIRHLALNEVGLRAVAPEVIGVFCTLAAGDATKGMEDEEAWMALVSVWRMSAFAADRWTAEHGRRRAAPPVVAAAPPLPRPVFLPLPRSHRWYRRLRPPPALLPH